MARNSIEKRVRDVELDRERQREARINDLVKQIEVALGGNTSAEAEATDGDENDGELWGDKNAAELLTELGALLDEIDDVKTVVRGGGVTQHVAILWQQYRRRRRRGMQVADLVQEHGVYSAVAGAVGVFGSYGDQSGYAPVRLEALDIPGASSRVADGEQTEIARRRVGASDPTDLEDRAVTLPLRDARHILVVADPRQGKDSTICRIAGNLKDEHGYKWISLYDDGRNENRMIHIPSDDENIHDSLDQFNQAPKGYETDVFVPATDLPDELPDNHTPFSVSVDDLTPDILSWLAGIKPGGQTEQRLSQALQAVQNGTGEVSELITQLRTYAEETTARVTVSEPAQSPEDGSDDVEYEEYEMSEDTVLENIVESLTIAAGQGIIRDRGAGTNIDMHDVLADQDRVAALNANHVDDGLKHLCVLVWLALIWDARGDDPSLPRVAVECREIKALAPSKNKNSRYSSITNGLHQVLYLYTTQGSARRIMLLASVQKVTDFEKSLRSNMDINILLKIKGEKINAIQWSFTPDERHKLRNMPTGWGMIAGGGEEDGRPEKVYPINFCGARCGLSYGDLTWKDRYGVASGWRVAYRGENDMDELPRAYDDPPTGGEDELTEYINGHGDRVTADENPLEPGDWYLTPGDVTGYDSVDDALSDRMRDGMPGVVKLHDPGEGVEEVSFDLLSQAEREERQLDDVDIPAALETWLEHEDKIERWVTVLSTIEDDHPSSLRDLSDAAGVARSTITDDADRPVGACWQKRDGEYTLTALGRKALEQDWTALTRA
ncbi:hypothetical protein C478_07337 [Natrinema thermotolerans DSM 11552]|nr:hypothetical protein C478_07337 [Natrinema thermotolerans DSM 11552]